ncbi:IDEAL domain-containing protein [Paenibacillus soyae]|uniref:IDEAL domain-containing protein n=1 Tax=Paenibacillus soyae TaxID=2969249 RepID=A0A9X2SC84_9BACL|nr:IDEAL domain-containing protein [Paenibacillus soyae]MCR2805747.1 IDEAL domain-containing protein [Paenibacillus soyae]
MRFNVSDWVHGKTVEGEMVYGFVEAVDSVQGIVTIYVVKSDQEDRVGREVDVRSSTVRKVPDAKTGDFRVPELIDLALATWDEAWFRELTGEGGRSTAYSEGGTATKVPPANRVSRFLR